MCFTTPFKALIFLFAIFIASAPPGAAQTKPAGAVVAPDDAQQRLNEQAETRKRNLSRPALTAKELNILMEEPTHKAHLQLWRDQNSFYALQEIAEGIIEPELGRIRRQDIQMLLGVGSPNYPNSRGRILDYSGNRQIPQGSHLLIFFDGNNIAEHTEWVSE
jgi:hypothetical protein